MNIVVPMAGRGSRFSTAGYDVPKPLIPVHGRPMIEVVVENVRPSRSHRFIFLCLDEHVATYGVDRMLKELVPGCEVVLVGGVTEGAACTVLLATDLIDDAEPLMIVNSDQWVDCDIDRYLAVMDEGGWDGLIMTMADDDPKWSYVRLGADRRVLDVVEKEVVSNEATVGIYNFRRGADFVKAAATMIAKGLRVGGEYYVAPAYNQLIAAGAAVSYFNVGGVNDGMYGLGTPDDLHAFLDNPVSRCLIP